MKGAIAVPTGGDGGVSFLTGGLYRMECRVKTASELGRAFHTEQFEIFLHGYGDAPAGATGVPAFSCLTTEIRVISRDGKNV
jgi:hypothetical protein